MVRRDVEHLEVREVVLDLRALVDDEAELAEDAGNLVDRRRDRVESAATDRPTGRRDVDRLAPETRLERGSAEQVPTLRKRGLDRLADDIRDRTNPRPIFRRQPSDPPEDRGEPTLAPEHVELERLQRRNVGRGGSRCERVVAQALKIAGQLAQIHKSLIV